MPIGTYFASRTALAADIAPDDQTLRNDTGGTRLATDLNGRKGGASGLTVSGIDGNGLTEFPTVV